MTAARAPSPARPLRVVHVCQQLRSGGAETLIRGLCAGLAEDGFAVSAVSIYDDALDAPARAALPFDVVSGLRRGQWDAAFFPRLVAQLRRLRPDVVHAHLHAGKYAGRAAAIAAGVPVIVFTEHGDELGGGVRRAANRLLHPHTTRFVTFSEGQRARFAASEAVALEKIVVIPNGIAAPPPLDRAAARAALGLASDACALYLPARFSEQKHQSLAVRAFARLAPARPHWRLVLAGQGPLEDRVRDEALALGLADRVAFLGFREDAAALCRAMDAFLMPSRWERMPLALGEAMRSGLPVVTTPWDGVDDFVRDRETGIVAAGMSVDDYAAALARLDDTAAAAAIGSRARAFADERFDLAASVRRHADLYRTLAPGAS
jgi:glycosyltransferase involved in cell wall biosynthesis